MKLLTKDTDYATRALLHLARHPGEWVSSRAIASGEGIPLSYMRRILQVLAHEGWIRSREGVDGGVQLTRTPAEITLLDLIDLFQGEVEISQCLFRQRICQNRMTCPLRRRIERIRTAVEDEFKAITLAGLLQDLAAANRPPDETETCEQGI